MSMSDAYAQCLILALCLYPYRLISIAYRLINLRSKLMENTTYEAKTTSPSDEAEAKRTTTHDDKAHYASDDDFNWDTWWGEYIDGE